MAAEAVPTEAQRRSRCERRGGRRTALAHHWLAGTQFTVMSTGRDARLHLGMFTHAADPAANRVSATRSAIPITSGQALGFNPVSWGRGDLPSSAVNRAVLAALGSGPVLDVMTI
jgi:hypothetical protein